MDDSERYQKHLGEAANRQEALCRRCGGCCGLFEKDPCVKLKLDENGLALCSDYENRFGMQKTVNGNEFKCVSVRHILSGTWPGAWKCGYKRQ